MLDSKSTQQSVFVLGNGSLFDEGVTQLLRSDSSMMVSHIVYSDEIAFLHMVKQDRPDAVLICDPGTLDTGQVIDSISIDPIVLGLCIFVVRLSNPIIDVYERPIQQTGNISYKPRRIFIRTESDLLDLLRKSLHS